MNPRIPYTKPFIAELEVAYATDAARNGWGERCLTRRASQGLEDIGSAVLMRVPVVFGMSQHVRGTPCD
jgi:hypothetical protein